MIICKRCFWFNEPYEEAMFDYWQWFDATEDIYDTHGKRCDICGKEFDDGECVILTREDMAGKKKRKQVKLSRVGMEFRLNKIITKATEFCKELERNYHNDRDITSEDMACLIKILEGRKK